jgi:hypothetical protein
MKNKKSCHLAQTLIFDPRKKIASKKLNPNFLFLIKFDNFFMKLDQNFTQKWERP